MRSGRLVPWMLSTLMLAAGCDIESIPVAPTGSGNVRPVGSVARPVFLTELYEPLALIDRIKEGLPAPERTEWLFETAGDAEAWSASGQVTELAIRDGALTGRSTGAVPLLRVERTGEVAAWDSVHAYELMDLGIAFLRRRVHLSRRK